MTDAHSFLFNVTDAGLAVSIVVCLLALLLVLAERLARQAHGHGSHPSQHGSCANWGEG